MYYYSDILKRPHGKDVMFTVDFTRAELDAMGRGARRDGFSSAAEAESLEVGLGLGLLLEEELLGGFHDGNPASQRGGVVELEKVNIYIFFSDWFLHIDH
jgi:hypothetical protein